MVIIIQDLHKLYKDGVTQHATVSGKPRSDDASRLGVAIREESGGVFGSTFLRACS